MYSIIDRAELRMLAEELGVYSLVRLRLTCCAILVCRRTSDACRADLVTATSNNTSLEGCWALNTHPRGPVITHLCHTICCNCLDSWFIGPGVRVQPASVLWSHIQVPMACVHVARLQC